MIDRVMLNGVAYAVTVANNPLPDDKVITVDGVQYIVGEPIVEAISEGGGVVGSIDKVVVNGNIYDIQDVEDVARETERATQAEKGIKSKALQTDTVHFSQDTRGVTLGGRTIDGKSVVDELIPFATTEMPGVMSASDKAKLDASIKYVDISPNVGDVELDLEDNTGEITHIVFPEATTEKAGVMSAEDKNILNSVGTNEYDALSIDRRTDGFAYHVSGISLDSTYEGQTIGRNTCSICEKITLIKGQKVSFKAYAENLNAIIITDANNKVIFLSGAYTVAKGEYTATDTCYIYCTAYTNQISSDSYHCTVSASGMKATVERLDSHVNILQSKKESFMQGYRELFVNGTLNVEMEQGAWTGFGEVGEKYVEKIATGSTYSHYKFNVNKGTRLKYRLYAGGYYNIVATDTNGVILHKVGDSANWANHEGEYVATEEVVIYINQAVTHATMEHSGYYAILVDKDIRPRIDIKASDSEIEIWYKFRKARLVGGYDVYFEHATYTFKEIYDVWKAMNVQDYELPIGGGCNYYCNGSTFISVDPESGHVGSRATFGVGRSVQSFCIQDAVIVNIGGTYCFHDEGEAKEGYYLHKYVNCKMKYIANEHTTYLSKPLGGGMGLQGDVLINDCYFENTNTIETNGRRAYPVSWHGNLLTDSPCTFNLHISNSVFVGGFIDLGGNEKNQGDTNTLYLANNNADTEPYISKTGNWTTYIWNNVIRH